MVSSTLPNQTRFLLQYTVYISLIILSGAYSGSLDISNVMVMIIIELIFIGMGWLLFKWLHRVEWQYLQGYRERGYKRLKAFRWVVVLVITTGMIWAHWQNPDLAESPLWMDALLSYWSTWATVWFVSLWVLWPIAYYKKPTEAEDYVYRHWPDDESK